MWGYRVSYKDARDEYSTRDYAGTCAPKHKDYVTAREHFKWVYLEEDYIIVTKVEFFEERS